MSTVRLKSTDDVEMFLKILAEESVKEATSAVSNVDPMQGRISDMLKVDKDVYKVDAQDSQSGDVDDDLSLSTKSEDDNEPTQPESDENDIEVSLDSVADAIKTLRSGRSVDDSQISAQMRTYFDRLDDQERQVLLIFLRSFAGILTGSVTGADAQDPSEPPENIKMSAGEEDIVQEPEKDTAGIDHTDDEEEEEEKHGPEDTSPPIRVGEQRVNEIREKVRSLMSL